MKYRSTGKDAPAVTVSEAIRNGLAPDGGLYVPERFPAFQTRDFARVVTLPEVGRILLEPFFEGDPLQPELPAICQDAFSFPIPLRPVNGRKGVSVIELFHGPTAAFKDVGARFLAACLERLEQQEQDTLKVLVATSGDTGGAVAAAFHRRPGIEVKVLYPAGMVSPRQEQQLTCWGDNIHAFRVAGAFDDCQRLVKAALASEALTAECRLTSANSISIGRLLPQAVYYAAASLWHWREHGKRLSLIIPTGNLGNAVAAVWARATGLPVGTITLATNANKVIPDYLSGGDWQPRQSLATLASAMDVGNPSNMARLQDLHPDFSELAASVDAFAVSDEQIRRQIRTDYSEHGELWCPHTATAAHVADHHYDFSAGPVAIVATAHPAKFETVIEPLIGETIPVPPALANLFDLPSHADDLGTEPEAFFAVLRST